MASLTALDIIVFLLIGLGAVMGLMRGFVSEVLSLLAWVASVMALRLFYEPVRLWAGTLVDSPSGAAVMAFALVFLVTFFLFKLLAARLGERTRQSIVGPFDRLLGCGFGALKGLIAASLIFLATNLAYDTFWGIGEPRPAWMAASRTYPLLRMSSRLIVDFVERRRHQSADETEKPASRRPSTSRDDAGEGYDRRERRDLNQLLDAANAFST